MVTTAERVRAYLRRDPVLARGLARGTVSLRRAARWLIESQEWDVAEEAVVSALRRTDPDLAVTLAEAAEMLGRKRLMVRRDVATVTVTRDQETESAVSEIRRAVGPEGTWAVLPHREAWTLLVDGDHLDEVRAVLDEDTEPEIVEDLAQIRVEVREPGPVGWRAGVIALLTSDLGHREIQVNALFSAGSTVTLVVPEGDAGEASEIVQTQPC